MANQQNTISQIISFSVGDTAFWSFFNLSW
jgi:hypothetical protein